MRIETKKSFDKSYGKLSEKDKVRVKIALWIFMENPFHSQLRNHELKGEYAGLRSLDAGFDLRIIYKELSGWKHELVALIIVGSHSDIYW